MCFDGLMVRSLERTEIFGRLGSGEGGLCGGISNRVRVPFGLKIMWSDL